MTIRPKTPEKSPESTGCSAPPEDPVPVPDRRRPMSTWWISDELLDRTIDVWSRAYGRPVSEKEAIGMLMNIKRLGEFLVDAREALDQAEGGEAE